MKATVIKKYELNRDEIEAINLTMEILRDLEYQDFENDFIDNRIVYIGDVRNALEDILEMDGVDWSE